MRLSAAWRASRDSGEFERVYQGPLQLVEVSNLRSGYTYRFRVTAFNEVGRAACPAALDRPATFEHHVQASLARGIAPQKRSFLLPDAQ